MLLGGDVGGTKTRLCLFDRRGGMLSFGVTERFDSRSAASFEDIALQFLEKHKARPSAACFGVPGPVKGGVAKLTNLPWVLVEQEISTRLNIPKVRLVNDLAATAASLPHLTPQQLLTLHPGTPGLASQGSFVVYGVVAPGTGLGEALLVQDSGKLIPIPSEAGHADFAPVGEEQVQLQAYVAKKYGRCSVERVLCGPGLYNIYQFLRDENICPEPSEIKERMEKEDKGAVITDTGLSKQGAPPKYEISARALDIFASILGQEAGNQMLRGLTFGGVFLGGGIPPRIVEKLKDGTTVRSFLAKHPLEGTVREAPLHVITDDHAALIGAAHLAASL